MNDDTENGMRCNNCYYAEPRYDKEGLQIGVDCMKDNARFIEMDVALVQYCGAYAERD